MVVRTKRRKQVRQSHEDKALSYTGWGSKYPWHVSGNMEGKYPKDRTGHCTCKCVYCRRRGRHMATKAAHLKS